MKNIYFSTKDLTVGYNGEALIKDIQINIEKGEILTLIGPNGSGKSTILKSITKHLKTISGDTFIAEASVGAMNYKELSKLVAVVLTDRIKPELMTCRDVVATGRYPYTGSMGILGEEDNKKVEEAMEKVHALDIAEKDFIAISDGQKQRILLARAICQEPDVIVLDEPTSFLDIKHKLELLSILRSMAKEKKITVIMSLHEIDLAQKISDKVMCVKGDMIEHFGSPDAIFKDDIIKDLYDITSGVYNIAFGSVELPKPEGIAETFVISSCGRGIDIYRRLQKNNIPFYAGILYSNDIDYIVAKSLAIDVFEEKPFMPISDDVFGHACEAIKKCKCVINAGIDIGQINKRMEELLKLADECGILKRI